MRKIISAIAALTLTSNVFAFAITGVTISNPNSIPRNTAFDSIAHFRYGIRNDTNINQEYLIRYSICADNKGCVNGERRLPFAPHGSMDDAVDLPMNIAYNNAGIYNISAYIVIDGESISRNESHIKINIY